MPQPQKGKNTEKTKLANFLQVMWTIKEYFLILNNKQKYKQEKHNIIFLERKIKQA